MDEEVLKEKTLLVVDDEVDLRDIMASEFEYMGAKVFQAGNISLAKDILAKGPIDLIVSDIRMPGGTGIELLDFVKSRGPSFPPVLLITGFADISVEDAYNKGAEALINKPFKLDDLIRAVERYALSPEERYTDPQEKFDMDCLFEFEGELATNLENGRFLIGRGGVSFIMGLQKRALENGQGFNFNFKFLDRSLEGSGVCRWAKVVDTQSTAMGIELLYLSPSTLDFFKEYWQKHALVPFIPTLVP